MKPCNLILSAVLVVVFCGLAAEAGHFEAGEPAGPWTHLNFNNKAENFQFVIVADRTGGHRPGVFADAVAKINLLGPEFVICVGDLIEGGTRDEAEIERQWKELDGIVSRLEMPFFYLPGNHDVSNGKLLEAWKKRFGRTYYYFIYQNVLFLCMDSTGEPYRINDGDITKEEADYFEGVIEKHKKVRWTIVIMHKPAWERNGENWLRLEKTLGERDYTVFAGHKHQYAKTVRQGRTYIRVATTGGTSPLKGPVVGTFDHIMWVTMSDKGPRIANLMPDGIYDENVTSYVAAAAAKMVKDKSDAGEVVRMEPLVMDGEVFKGGRTMMTIVNFVPIPMTLTGRFRSADGISIRPKSIETTVGPLLRQRFEIAVDVNEPLKAEEVKTIVFEGEIGYSFGGKQPVTTKVTGRLPVVRQAHAAPGGENN